MRPRFFRQIGKLVGNFYDEEGNAKPAMKEFQANLAEAQQDKENKNAEKQIFPPCNSEWSKKKGHRVWCTAKTGGELRLGTV